MEKINENNTPEFEEILKYCKKNNLFLGEGNPKAKILFVGQEIGYGDRKDKKPTIDKIIENSEELTNDNLKRWTERISIEQYLSDLQKFFKDNPNIPTWKSYQKIVNVILGRDIDEKQYDFLNYSFITEYSQLSLPKSSYLDKDKEFIAEKTNNINKRKSLFEKEEIHFFKNFPIVIMACGHYATRKYPIDMPQIFGVKWEKEISEEIFKELSAGYCNLHYGKDKVLIHTRQLSNFRINKEIVNQLLTKIGELCKHFYKI